eukprot:scaffold115225_cov51-Phaeocystis_antarctica.AAC.3
MHRGGACVGGSEGVCQQAGDDRLAAPIGDTAGSKCPGSQRLTRPPAAPEAQPLAQRCPLGPRGEASPLGCQREPALALWSLPKAADVTAFDHPGDGCGTAGHCGSRGDVPRAFAHQVSVASRVGARSCASDGATAPHGRGPA